MAEAPRAFVFGAAITSPPVAPPSPVLASMASPGRAVIGFPCLFGGQVIQKPQHVTGVHHVTFTCALLLNTFLASG